MYQWLRQAGIPHLNAAAHAKALEAAGVSEKMIKSNLLSILTISVLMRSDLKVALAVKNCIGKVPQIKDNFILQEISPASDLFKWFMLYHSLFFHFTQMAWKEKHIRGVFFLNVSTFGSN